MSDPIQYRNIAELRTSPNNYRRGDVGAIITSIITFGFNNALRVWQGGIVKAGNHTLLAIQSIKAQGLSAPQNVQVRGNEWLVPCIDISHLSQTEADAFLIADNRLSEIAENDDTQLAALLSAIASEDETLLTATGYDGDDLDALLQALADDALAGVQVTDVEPQIDKADELQKKWQTSKGQLWIIPSKRGKGEHRLLCGDSTNADDVARVMGGEKADCMINDPPYGMRLDADFSGAKTNLKFAAEKGAFGGRKYDNVIGDHEDYDASVVLAHFDYVKEQLWFGADYYSSTLPDTMHSGCWLVWDKRLDESADLMYGSCFELMWSKQKHKRDVLRHKWAGIFGVEQELERQRFHPTQKPSSLIRDLIDRYSKPNMLIVDCYCGSGTTLVACEQTVRYGRGIEIDARYVAVSLQRLADMGLQPRLSN